MSHFPPFGEAYPAVFSATNGRGFHPAGELNAHLPHRKNRETTLADKPPTLGRQPSAHPKGLSQVQIRALFHGHVSKKRIDLALEQLSTLDLIDYHRQPGRGRGRPSTIWTPAVGAKGGGLGTYCAYCAYCAPSAEKKRGSRAPTTNPGAPFKPGVGLSGVVQTETFLSRRKAKPPAPRLDHLDAPRPGRYR